MTGSVIGISSNMVIPKKKDFSINETYAICIETEYDFIRELMVTAMNIRLHLNDLFPHT